MSNLKGSIQRAKATRRKKERIEIPGAPHTNEDGTPILNDDGTPKCDYWVRMMNVDERSQFDLAMTKEVAGSDERKVDVAVYRSQLLLRTLCEGENDDTRVFSDDEIALVQDLPSTDWNPAFMLSQKLNGLDGSVKKIASQPETIFRLLLAGHLKIGTLEELEERMSSFEYELWKERFKVRPFGDERYQIAYLCSVIANVNRGKDEPGRMPDEFLPVTKEAPAKVQPVSEQLAMADALVTAWNGSQ